MKPTGFRTLNTSNPSGRTYFRYQDRAQTAMAKENPDPPLERTSGFANSADSASPNMSSSLSLTQWFDTLMGLSGRLTPKRSPGRATTLGKIGPEKLKVKFICTHLAHCTRMKECQDLRSTWLRGKVLRPNADVSFIASTILAAHRKPS
jgi:hypothetical protein